MEDLKRLLREAAAAHEPDRTAMLARVRHGKAGHPRPAKRPAGPLSWPRITLATLVSATVLLAGGYAITTVLQSEGPARNAATAPPVPAPPAPTQSPLTPSAPSRSTAPPRTHAGPLRADGSIDPHSNPYWTQSNITLETGAPLGALTLEVRIAPTGGVTSTGAWRTLPEDDFTLTVTDDNGTVTYRWTLKPGRTAPPGRHTFAVQYNHAPSDRPTTGDTYTATVTTTKNEQYTVTGGFRPAKPRG